MMPAGLRFECQPGCTECCRQRGFVFLTEADVERAAVFLQMTVQVFERQYVFRSPDVVRLRVPHGSHCHFLLAGGCSIHPAKPTQCRVFPFWPELVDEHRKWEETAEYCPGIGKGELIQIEQARELGREFR